MCNQNSCFGGSSCCWIIIAIILLFLFCGNGCGNGCGWGGKKGGVRRRRLRLLNPRYHGPIFGWGLIFCFKTGVKCGIL